MPRLCTTHLQSATALLISLQSAVGYCTTHLQSATVEAHDDIIGGSRLTPVRDDAASSCVAWALCLLLVQPPVKPAGVWAAAGTAVVTNTQQTNGVRQLMTAGKSVSKSVKEMGETGEFERKAIWQREVAGTLDEHVFVFIVQRHRPSVRSRR